MKIFLPTSRILFYQLVALLSAVLILISGLAAGAEPFKIPSFSSPVVDEVGLLSAAQKAQIEENLYQFRQQKKAQIQILITANLGDETIETAAIKVFDQWKIGNEKSDDGLLLLIAPKEKKLRIEVGQGLEGDVPDITAKRIVAEVIRPYFKRGEFAQGIVLGLASIQQAILGGEEFSSAGSPTGSDQARPKKDSGKSNGFIFLILLGLWFVIFLISPSTALNILMIALSRGGGGGGGSRGGWSGGGGSSSGGGASGDW